VADLTVVEQASHLANDFLVWVGFGTLAGLTAKALMPGKDPGGALTTLLMGIGGSVIGCGVLMFCLNGQRVTPISTIGFIVATAGAFILLGFARLLGGNRKTVHVQTIAAPHSRRRSSTRSRIVQDVDEL
jgi:uncharacterized membrane protein YeaQ/YmgE (transglycosylase-associated protein family)